jgi:hypothetical protein
MLQVSPPSAFRFVDRIQNDGGCHDQHALARLCREGVGERGHRYQSFSTTWLRTK